ncbi:MAG: Rrf2 family transcriptional regulator [Spirochaetes bacterium]|nr:Rrf2 family transcriptional regulator [Spirochaetota bacterium]
MKISTRTRYGFRFMINLGLDYSKDYNQLSKIAEKEHISDKYLENIVRVLKLSGLIQVKRGAQGGYRLSRNPAEISVLEIFEILEGSLNIIDCLENSFSCELENSCIMTDFWGELIDQIKFFLKSRTLADLVNNYKKKNNIDMYYI